MEISGVLWHDSPRIVLTVSRAASTCNIKEWGKQQF